jgi:divalent metal cation (Fe/Co/Zn/Cd) transporter
MKGTDIQNHRRGHHHKRSLSHQIFLPPPERPLLPLPSHLPIPTISEILSHSNINSHHVLPILLQIMSTLYLSQASTGESSLVALTFLAINDLLASFVQLFSRTITAFDVWRSGTLRFPFGLQRLEGLAEFGLGVFGTFTGLYVLKETVEDIIIGFSTHEVLLEGSSGGHHHHHHYIEADPERYPKSNYAVSSMCTDWWVAARVSAGSIDLPVLLLGLCTVYLMRMLSPHANTSKLIAIPVEYLTLTSSIVIILIPLLGLPSRHIIDRGVSLLIAFIMVAIGLSAGRVWGSILLCVPSKDEKTLIRNVPIPPLPHLTSLILMGADFILECHCLHREI